MEKKPKKSVKTKDTKQVKEGEKEPKQSKTNPTNPTGLDKEEHKTMAFKKEIRRKWSTIQKDIEGSGGFSLKIGRPKLFETPEELLELFNLYLASIQEKKSVKDKELTEIYDRNIGRSWKKNQTTELKGVKVSMKLKEIWIFKEKPSKLKFYVFLGGMHSDTWTEYKKKEAFSEAIELIETYLESVIEDGAISGEINPTIAQFVLNTTYGRVPKNINLDKDYTPTEEENNKINKLLEIN